MTMTIDFLRQLGFIAFAFLCLGYAGPLRAQITLPHNPLSHTPLDPSTWKVPVHPSTPTVLDDPPSSTVVFYIQANGTEVASTNGGPPQPSGRRPQLVRDDWGHASYVDTMARNSPYRMPTFDLPITPRDICDPNSGVLRRDVYVGATLKTSSVLDGSHGFAYQPGTGKAYWRDQNGGFRGWANLPPGPAYPPPPPGPAYPPPGTGYPGAPNQPNLGTAIGELIQAAINH